MAFLKQINNCILDLYPRECSHLEKVAAVMRQKPNDWKMPERVSWYNKIFTNFGVFYKVGIILIIWGAKCIAEAVGDNRQGNVMQSAIENLNGYNASTLALGTTAAVLAITWLCMRLRSTEEEVS